MEAELWLLESTLTVEHAGELLSACEVRYDASFPGRRGGSGKLLEVGKPTLFETPFASGQMRLFGLAETLGDDGWLKMLRLDDYAPRGRVARGCCSRPCSPTRTPSEADPGASKRLPIKPSHRRCGLRLGRRAPAASPWPPRLGRGS